MTRRKVLARVGLTASAFTLTTGFFRLDQLFVPDKELWPFWSAAGAATGIDHGAWDALVGRYRSVPADGIARFAYGDVGGRDREALRGYLRAVQALPIREYTRAEQFAYWVNLYNATTVNLVLDAYPVASIRDIKPGGGLFAIGPWDAKLLRVEGQEVSLNDVEHRILRPIFADPRLHYVVNCAARGCPNLPPRALTPANAEGLREDGARAFVNHPRGARVDGGRLHVSSIYRWFQDDFGGSERAVIRHLRRYADPPLATALTGVSGIAGDDYDWALNDAGAAGGA